MITLEADAGRAEMAAPAHRGRARTPRRSSCLEGDARAIVPTLDGPFDLVFIDAWKGDYPHYYEAVLPKLTDHGLIVCDNVLWGGDVVDPRPTTTTAARSPRSTTSSSATTRVENALSPSATG